MEVKNKYAYVIMQDICNKFIEVNVFVGCMVSLPNRLLQRLNTMSLINKIVQVIFNEINTLFVLLNQNMTTDCYLICTLNCH